MTHVLIQALKEEPELIDSLTKDFVDKQKFDQTKVYDHCIQEYIPLVSGYRAVHYICTHLDSAISVLKERADALLNYYNWNIDSTVLWKPSTELIDKLTTRGIPPAPIPDYRYNKLPVEIQRIAIYHLFVHLVKEEYFQVLKIVYSKGPPKVGLANLTPYIDEKTPPQLFDLQ